MGHIKTMGTLMSEKFPEQVYLVDRIIPDSAITIMSGASRAFKTYTLLETAIAVASGKKLFGQFETQLVGVLIIDEENGDRLLQKRLKQLGADDSLPIHFSSLQGFTLEDKKIKEILNYCVNNSIGLVIIDSLIRIHGSDENSSRDMSKVFKQLRQFTEEGIALLVTQHNRKQGNFNTGAGNEMRGSSDILAAVDSHIGVVRKNKLYLQFDQSKQRYDLELDPFEVKVTVDNDNFSFEYLGTINSRIDQTDILRTAVISLLKEVGPLSQTDIEVRLRKLEINTNEHKLRALLKRWVAEELLLPPIKGSVGNTKLYKLNEGETS